MRAGGHATLDPLAALAFCAASTSRLRLMTYLLVLPYRNPLAAAKTIASVDLMSNGRLTIGAGGGYLRSEFGALGVDFEERGALFDEALEVLRGVCTEEAFRYEGRHFTARGVTLAPGPVQVPHPPVWIGGNGLNARRRVARFAQGWSPLLVGPEVAATTRMPPLTVADLAAAVTELRDLVAAASRDPDAIDVQVQSQLSGALGEGRSADELRDHLGQLADAGATWFVVRVPVASAEGAFDVLAEFGREIIGARVSDRA
jgi:probable F420-dependent oxidoreductase